MLQVMSPIAMEVRVVHVQDRLAVLIHDLIPLAFKWLDFSRCVENVIRTDDELLGTSTFETTTNRWHGRHDCRLSLVSIALAASADWIS